MFSQNTVLVLGAGASFEAGLPVGKTLKLNISEALEVEKVMASGHSFSQVKDEVIRKSLISLADQGNEGLTLDSLMDACAQISAALPLARSIDNYLDSNKSSKAIEVCGKLGIVRSILIAEHGSKMKSVVEAGKPTARPNFHKLDGTWYNVFSGLLFDSTFEALQARLKKLTVIIFNYDRCFEHFMYHAIVTYYGVSSDVAAQIVNSMAIYHPYGTVGNLAWMGNQPQCEFGELVDENQLLELARNIKTYTEGVDPESGEIQSIHRAMRQAKIMVFLGFGYIPLNMTLLKPPQNALDTEPLKTFYATAFGISDSDIRIVPHNLCTLVTGAEHSLVNIVRNLTCVELFGEFSLGLGES